MSLYVSEFFVTIFMHIAMCARMSIYAYGFVLLFGIIDELRKFIASLNYGCHLLPRILACYKNIVIIFLNSEG